MQYGNVTFVELIRLADSYNLVLIPFLSFVMLAFGMTHDFQANFTS